MNSSTIADFAPLVSALTMSEPRVTLPLSALLGAAEAMDEASRALNVSAGLREGDGRERPGWLLQLDAQRAVFARAIAQGQAELLADAPD